MSPEPTTAAQSQNTPPGSVPSTGGGAARSAGGAMRGSLRGLDFASQEAALAPVQRKPRTASGAVQRKEAPGATSTPLAVEPTPSGAADVDPAKAGRPTDEGDKAGDSKDKAGEFVVDGHRLRYASDSGLVEVQKEGAWVELTEKEAALRRLDQNLVTQGADPDQVLTYGKGSDLKDAIDGERLATKSNRTPKEQAKLNEFLTGQRAKFRDGLKLGEQYQKRQTFAPVAMILGIPLCPFLELSGKFEYGLLKSPFDDFDTNVLDAPDKAAFKLPFEAGAQANFAVSAGLSAGIPDIATLDVKGTVALNGKATVNGEVALDYPWGETPSWDHLSASLGTEMSAELIAKLSIDLRLGFPPYAWSTELLNLVEAKLATVKTSSKAIFDFKTATLATVEPFDPSEWELDFGKIDEGSYFASLYKYFQGDDDAHNKVVAFKKAGILDKLTSEQRQSLLSLINDAHTGEEHEQSIVDLLASAGSPHARLLELRRCFERTGGSLMDYDQLRRFIIEDLVDDNASAQSAILRQLDEDLVDVEPALWFQQLGAPAGDFIFRARSAESDRIVPRHLREAGEAKRTSERAARRAEQEQKEAEEQAATERAEVDDLNAQGGAVDAGGNPVDYVEGGSESSVVAPTHAKFRALDAGLDPEHLAALAQQAGVTGRIDLVPVELTTMAQKRSWVLRQLGVSTTSFGDPIGSGADLMSLPLDALSAWAQAAVSVAFRVPGVSGSPERFAQPGQTAGEFTVEFTGAPAGVVGGFVLVNELRGSVPEHMKAWLMANVALTPKTFSVRLSRVEFDPESGAPSLDFDSAVTDDRLVEIVDLLPRSAGVVTDVTQWPRLENVAAVSRR